MRAEWRVGGQILLWSIFDLLLLQMNARSRKNLMSGNLSKIAMTMALPHENSPVRLPVVPVVPTATVDLMCDASAVVPDGKSRRAMLCRDPCFPLWMDRTLSDIAFYMANPASGAWAVPNTPNTEFMSQQLWDSAAPFYGGTPTCDGAALSFSDWNKFIVLANSPVGPAMYVPAGARLNLRLAGLSSAVASTSVYIAAEIRYYYRGEWMLATLAMQAAATTDTEVNFIGVAGSSSAPVQGMLIDGPTVIPSGFIAVTGLRTSPLWTYGPSTTATFQLAWTPSGTVFSPLANTTLQVLLPFFTTPAEFLNSTVPYSRTRTNASAALFTNVSAVLRKEGTILASRLKSDTVDFHSFAASDINAVHPAYRYYGPLEKGLYTFTTPSATDLNLRDCIYEWINTSGPFGSVRNVPLFSPENVGVYNAIIFSDLGSDSGTTQLAVSQYNHLEFESVSSLFTPGVSTATLETLHAAEVALVKFGHFHENPLHWAALAAAAKKALAFVAPMVAPVVQHYGQKFLDRGVAYLTGKPSGARAMPQKGFVQQQPPKRKPHPKKQAKKGKKK